MEKAIFLGKILDPDKQDKNVYAFYFPNLKDYYRSINRYTSEASIQQGIDLDRKRYPDAKGKICYSNSKEDIYGAARAITIGKDCAKAIEAFAASDSHEKKEMLKNMAQEALNNFNFGSLRPVFEKIETTYKHEVLNKSKFGQARTRLIKKIDSILGTNLKEKRLPIALKKAEKTVSDKLFGKVRE